jgi:hypothetical protein
MSAIRPASASKVRRTVVGIVWFTSAVGALLLVIAGSATSISGGGIRVVLGFVGLATAVLVYASVGAILTLRRPGNRMGLVLMTAAGFITVTFLGFVFGAVLTGTRGKEDVIAGIASLFGVLGIYPTLILVGPIVALLFPDGKLPGPVWRWPIRAIASALAVGSALIAVQPGPIGASFANNPLGISGVAWLTAVSAVGVSLVTIALPSALLVALAGVIVRLQRAQPAERQQLKWFVAANVILIVFTLAGLSDGATQPTVFDFLGIYSLSLPPLAVGIAVLRYRLYEIDRIISRTLAYTVLTAALALVYVGAFLVLQAVLAPFTQSGGPLAVAASTLAVFALFQPLRRRLQAAMDRRFNRSRYDAQRTVEAFASQLRDEVDLDRVGGAVQTVVGQALAPTSVGIWLRPSDRAVER